MKTLFLSQRFQDILSLRSAMRLSNFGEFERIGSQMRAAAKAFQLWDLERIASAIECAGREKKIGSAVRNIRVFEFWHKKISSRKHERK